MYIDIDVHTSHTHLYPIADALIHPSICHLPDPADDLPLLDLNPNLDFSRLLIEMPENDRTPAKQRNLLSATAANLGIY